MNRQLSLMNLVLALAVAAVGAAVAADRAPQAGPGWTGLTNVKDVIDARQELMEQIENNMPAIDGLQVGVDSDSDQLRATAATLSAMLLAAPHLFPPTTNRYDPKAKEPETLALPAIWQDFTAFSRLAAASAAAAEQMANATTKEQLRVTGRNLRASCDACHALYMRSYTPPKAQDSDLEFDFDSAIKKK